MNENVNKVSSETQNRMILLLLKSGGTITSLEALKKFGCMRLASRIYDIRMAGHDVKDRWIVTASSNKRVKQYYMD